jgi:hypothetical protein
LAPDNGNRRVAASRALRPQAAAAERRRACADGARHLVGRAAGLNASPRRPEPQHRWLDESPESTAGYVRPFGLILVNAIDFLRAKPVDLITNREDSITIAHLFVT